MPKGPVRDTHAQQRILDATFALLSELGPGKVSVDEIARVAAVGKQTIYRWWPSKSALIMDALLLNSVRDTPFKDTGDARSDLRNHMRGVVRVLNSPTGTLIRQVVADSISDDKVAGDFIERFWLPRRVLTTEFLVEQIERGQVRADINMEAALDSIYGPLWVRFLIGFSPVDYSIVDEIINVVWNGLSATGANDGR
jgi:AcrR family transcriptional regulator